MAVELRPSSGPGPSPGIGLPGVPPDRSERERIATELSSTLFVEAGAGSGKTSALVDRVLALVTSGECELSHIAAITFTEKAAAELRDRIRSALETSAADHARGVEALRCRQALEQLDGAAIGTLHAFAQRILGEHPIEAGLPPHVEVLDEVTSMVAFEQRWSMFQDELLADPDMERTLLLFFAAGVRPDALRSIAQAFEDNWDLVEELVPECRPEPPSVHALFHDVRAGITTLATAAQRCSDPGDKLRLRIEEIAQRLVPLGEIDDEVELLEAISAPSAAKLPSFKVGNLGRKAAWDDVASVRAAVAAVGEALEGLRSQIASACAQRIGSAIRRFTLSAAHERQAAGRLQFHDLLVLARSLLRDPRHGAAVRTRLHDRYRRLLLDEFQDTDPIQLDLAVRIAASEPAAESTGTLPWDQVDVAPGRLFFVGDPKQSIYRFRRADIALFLAATARFGAKDLVELTANFRTGKPILDWVNAVFSALMAAPDDDLASTASQPRYVPLDGTRPAAPLGPPVSILGRDEHPSDTTPDALRSLEATAVAEAIARIVHDGWSVDDGKGGWRAARLGDIAIVVPARTSLPFLEDALEHQGIPFRAESSSLVYASRAVRDVLMVLRAVDDPTNALHIVAALRTPLLGCGDDDLLRFFRHRRGRWNYLGRQPDTVPTDDPVRRGLAYLRSLHEERHWLAPSQLLERIVRERRALELGFVEGRPRDLWRRIRFVVDQARAWSDATGGNLREYLAWVDRQASEGARVAEAILPETDDDAVRIMTIHAAKGLEFPITIVSGLSSAPRSARAPAQVVFRAPNTVGYRFAGNVTTQEFEALRPVDEQMEFHERIRLLYVACTRARDHLVLSVHRKARNHHPTASAQTNAELLVTGMGQLLADLPDVAAPGATTPSVPVERPDAPPPLATWRAEREAALERAGRARTVAATALSDEGTPDVEDEPDPGLRKRPRDLDLPPWLKGRYGNAVGRAVHGVLQSIDLATGDGLDEAVAAQCEAEAVSDRSEEVRQLVTAALGSPSVREAARVPHWREVYVCTPVDDRLLEGYLDLLYRTGEGLVVVDYKTAGTADPDELSRRLERYRNQGASYALAAASATGEPVHRVTFVFLTPAGAVERHLIDLDRAVEHVRALVSSGRELLVP